jgi:hypothetical protein
MDLSILTWAVIGLVIFGAPIAAAFGVVGFFNQLLAKPKSPVVRETAEEILKRQANIAIQNRKWKAMDEWRGTHPFPKGYAARRAYNAQSMAFYKTLDY